MLPVGWLAGHDAVLAQQSWGRPAVSEPAQQATPRKAPAKRAQPAASASTGDGSLRQRIEGLEEQLVDLQVVIGTLESLARSGSSSASPVYRGDPQAGGNLTGPDAGRIAALETQVQALTAQLERMSEELRALRSGAAPPPQAGGYRGPAPTAGGFNTTVTDNRSDPIGNLIGDNRAPAGGPAAIGLPPQTAAANARQSYETAYAHLLQQDYPAAESGFSEFLQRYPNDELAANAQFWLGETYFVRGQWDRAAAAFLSVAQKHARSDKAPDSLAKLAMSMERKGNKQAACRALAELNARYPNPPAHVKRWETTERRRAGCA
jgi:tol-pal system protein YbgF